ncbi:uncharacterized protein LOC129240321 isoform X5 [Anastrepha obliqua]|uniref:uncharacterized protein LOC129240321 isoform X5 n=1 Tax=Anastrepha obliqua TaxID=95512 RepID=UPI0024098759|nr:uncharacterized protein LOC129240321 isoform X5 [Anastrepha obliqua]
MERHRTLDSSMSSLYSGSNISNTTSAHRQQHDNYNYPALSSSASPTPSTSGGGGGGGGASLGLLTGASSTNAIATTGGSNTTNATTGHASDMSICSGDDGASVGLRATTIGSVVVRCGPIQLVIALLQSPEKLYIKVVELEPKITTLGTNLDESIRLQRDHDETLRNIQNLPGPMDEFVQKADKLLTSKRISSELVNAMADTLNIIWQDILHLLQDRQHILHLATQFHEKMVQCQRRMDQLEVACIDTMLPIEVAAVQEFLNKFKQLRIDMLTAVMAALKDGNELLSQLKELVNLETLDTRPEHIKRDATRAVHQVQHWLEALHDRRNALESAWQTRKTQLEHCLTLALLGRELDEVETALRQQRNEIDSLFSLGECEHTANNALHNYREWKQHALQLRDRALKITRAKEKLQASGTFTGDEACARAYNVLSACTEHLDLVDQREHWLQQSRDFFAKAENTLSVLEKLEVELTNVRLPPNSPESFAMYSKVARDVRSFTEEPLRLGYSILDEVGRTQPETQGVKRVLDEIENRKTYIESVCSTSNQDHQRVQKALSDFLAQYNDLLNWLMTSGQLYLKQHVDMGSTLQQCKQFLLQHHELMQDLEVSLSIHIHEKLRLKNEYLIFQIKGELINLLLESIKAHLESLSPQQRYDVDSKAEALHKHWIELKDLVLKRVDYVSLLIEFFEKANELASQLDNLDKQLKQTPDEQKLQFLQENWKHIRADYADLKSLGTRFITLKIVDPYLETKSSVAAVEDILNGFSKRQVDVTTSLDNWTTQIAEKREVEIILEKIMSDNEETATKTTQVDTQLYPVFTSLSVDARQLHSITSDKLTHVLQDIDKAQDELQHRIHTTLGIQTKNSESLQKIEQVISNLRSLKSKLDGIRYDYKTLLENILKFLMEIIELRHSIDDFFVKQKQQQQQLGGVEVADIEHTIVEHEKFRDGCMDKFRSLITQSELLIDRVRALEPPGAREIDTDRILKLLENLRIHFEANNSERMSRLERLGKLEQFKTDLCDINRSLDSVSKQLNEINGQSVDSLAAAKTTSLAFEYFERTIELLEKRIEKFTDNTTQQLLITNPESESYVREELQKLNEKWRNFKDQVRNKRKSLDQAAEFFEMVEKIDAEYREINYFYNSVSNKITYLRDPVEASNLVNDIEKYVVAREGPLLGKLENAAQCAHDMNKVSTLYNDVHSIFQAFMKLKSDINVVQERLKNEERLREQREKEAREQAERERAAREAEAKERAAREAEEREQAARELAAREKALRDEEARLQAIREQAMREQAAREQAAREEEVRLQALREQTQRDEEARLHALREQARREEETRLETLRIEETRLQLLREQTKREEEARLQAIREQVARDEEVRLQALREQTVREEEARLQALREQANREEQKRLLELREQATREEEARLQTLREQANREEEKRLLALREEEARLQALREQTKREEAVRLQSVRDQIDHQRIVTENIRKDIQVNEIFTEIKYVSPRFNRLLKDAITREGDKFTFECEVTGNPEPTVEWFKDGISIQNNPDYKTTYDRGVCRLVIEETFTADSARFSCHASNLVGSTDTSANLSVRENAIEMQMVPPRVIRYLESGKATEGSTFEFLCVVSGNPLPTVQWYKNDKCIDDSPDYVINYNNGEATLRFEEVFLEDDAVYTCSASNPAGIEHCSASLIVEPLEPTEVPHFKIPLTNAMARVGQKIKLEALIGGIPRPDIFWMHNGKPYVPRDSKYEYGRATLIIPQAYPNDAGVYVLTAKNLAGEVYSSCNVIVKGRLPNETSDSELASDMEPIKPSVQLPLKDVSIFEGKPVRLDCIIVGQPEPEVIWYHNERPVKESADVQLLFQGDRCSLIIQEVYQEDAGNYKVVAINSAGEASSSCELKVTPLNIAEPATRAQSERQSVPKETLPKFDKFLTDVLADEGETVEMEVIVSGDQPFTAKWYLANKELHENERISTSGNLASGAFKLTLRNVVADDRGVYTVKVSNNAGDAKCFSQLNIKSVNAPDHQRNQQVEPVEKLTCPEFKELFSDKQAYTDDMVKFECIVKGKPTPKVHWCFNDQPVHGHNFLVSTSGDRQVLTIQKASIDTVGKISCIAENEIGKATCVAFLNLLGADMQLMPATSDLQTSTQEHNTESSRVTINKKTFTTTSTSQISSFEGNMPQTEIHHSSAHIDQSLKQLGTQQPELVETHHYQELHKSKEMPIPNIQQKSFTLVQSAGTGSGQSTIASMTGVSVPESPTRLRKQIAPRFTMPLTGRIVDQGTDVSMEAIYDGFPSPEIKVVKNGEQLFDNQRLKIENRCNRVSIELKQVGVADAGRYAITATNTMGQSTSTADLVVKKTIFPPVFGRRLQAQVVKRGEKIIMEVEVTGLPEPTVVWMKDDKPIEEANVSQHRLLSQGNSYKLIIEKGVPSDSGKYMVKATNAGGEAKSIADCAILEPSPERLQEVVKTIVYETPSSLKTEDYKSMSSMSSSYYNASNISNISNVSAPKYQPSPVKTPTPAPMPTAAPIPAQRKTPAEFSDYSSEVEERFRSVSRTQESDSDIKGYRVVFPPTPTPKSHLTNGHKSPVVVITPSPMEFEPTPPAVSTYPRQKFEPIQKEIRHEFKTESQEHKQHFQQQKAHQQQQYQQQTVYKPKPVAAKFIAATQQQQERQQHQPPTPRTQPALYYNAIAGTPLHMAKMATETKNVMHMKESSETCQRVVNMQQTKRVIHFDSQKEQQERQVSTPLEPFPYSVSPNRFTPTRQTRAPPPATPTKFVPGEFRESDYDSEIENAKIHPLWTPQGEYGPLRFRHVEPPQTGRACSVPRSYERVLSPMEFDRGPEMPKKIQIDSNELRKQRGSSLSAGTTTSNQNTQSLNRHTSMQSSSSSSYQQRYQTLQPDHTVAEKRFPRDDMNLKVGSPPKYGYIQSHIEQQGKQMSSSFLQKSHQFIHDISSDLQQKTGKSTKLYNGVAEPKIITHSFRPGFQRAPSEGDNKPQAYRDESRVSQYGTKCVDPNTGLIYFKYDFGYEFGILFPGEGHKFVSSQWNSSSSTLPPRPSSATPTRQIQAGAGRKSPYPLNFPNGGDLVIPVQHERATTPTSTRTSTPTQPPSRLSVPYARPPSQSGYHSDTATSRRSPGPGMYAGTSGMHRLKKRYSLPNTQVIDINIDRLHDNDHLTRLPLISSVSDLPSDVPVNAHLNRDDYPKRPPQFITPLKEYAVMVGQCARFECIVQSHPPSNVTWSRNSIEMQNSPKHVIEYRNGVCRLTIPQAYPDDAGVYACTATNPLGTVTTSGQLLVQTKRL